MICSWCTRETSDLDRERCEHCERDPLLRSVWALEESLGHGAAGHTWRARHVDDDRDVAIKELSYRRVADLKQIELFEREARLLHDLDHPGIPHYEDDFVVEDDRHVSMYLVQELIDGEVLDVGGRTDEDAVVEMLTQLVDILRYLSDRRPPVVHRDIKPSNIMRRADGRYVLIDFGSTKAAIGATVGETTAGTLGYMAPEQLRGQASAASDVYGLAATAVALLGGAEASTFVDPHNVGAWRDDLIMSPHLGDLLEEMLEVDLSRRLTDLDEIDDRLHHEIEPRSRALLARPSASLTTVPVARPATTRRETAIAIRRGEASLAVEVASEPGMFFILAAPFGVAVGFMLAFVIAMVTQFMSPATLAMLPSPAGWWIPAWMMGIYLIYVVLLIRGRTELANLDD